FGRLSAQRRGVFWPTSGGSAPEGWARLKNRALLQSRPTRRERKERLSMRNLAPHVPAPAVRPVDEAVVRGRHTENVVVGEEIIRHKLLSRVIHWSVALTFFLALLSGLPIWTPVFG